MPGPVSSTSKCSDAGMGRARGTVSVLRSRRHRHDAQHDAALLGELDRVAEQVHQHLAQLALVGHDVARARPGAISNSRAQPLLLGAQAEHLLQALQQVVQVEGLLVQRGAPGLDLGHLQHVVDQPQQVLAAAVDDLQVLPLLRRQRRRRRPAPVGRSMSWVKPRMALSGVRSSWLMLARKTLLARLAASAASLARCSSTRVSFSSLRALGHLDLQLAPLASIDAHAQRERRRARAPAASRRQQPAEPPGLPERRRDDDAQRRALLRSRRRRCWCP